MEEAEAYWAERHPSVADKLSEALEQKTDALIDNPFMHQVYEDQPYFCRMSLPYGYLCFYHVDEEAKVISVHRILRGMRDLASIL